MIEHKQEPWKITDVVMDTDTIGGFKINAVKLPFSPLVCKVYFDTIWGEDHVKSCQANVHLIMAAPYLLKACREALDEMDEVFKGFGIDRPKENPVVDRLKAAVDMVENPKVTAAEWLDDLDDEE